MSRSVFLLAAGFGSRLRPLTNHRPKPLLPILGRPMLDYAVHNLQQIGHSPDAMMVNAHHLWKQVAAWAEIRGIAVQVELPDILGTGGGLRAAFDQLSERFLIWNGDILADIDCLKALAQCPEDGAAMVVRHENNLGKTTELCIDDQHVARIGGLCATNDAPALSDTNSGFHFTGIHAMSKAAVELIPPQQFACVVSTAYTTLVPQRKVNAVKHDGVWIDTGNPLLYWQANMAALRGDFALSETLDCWHGTVLSEGNWISETAKLGCALTNISESIVGAGAKLAADAHLHQCVVWDGANVPAGSHSRCIFYDGGVLNIEIDDSPEKS